MTDLFGDVQGDAHISRCGKFRHSLWRRWSSDPDLKVLQICMLNPSTADAEKNDPTLLRLMHFAESWGYGALYVVNLSSYRASKPTDMIAAGAPETNKLEIMASVESAKKLGDGRFLVAWGNVPAQLKKAEKWFVACARGNDVTLICLGTNKDGSPKHPMARGRNRVPDDQQPIIWQAARKTDNG